MKTLNELADELPKRINDLPVNAQLALLAISVMRECVVELSDAIRHANGNTRYDLSEEYPEHDNES